MDEERTRHRRQDASRDTDNLARLVSLSLSLETTGGEPEDVQRDREGRAADLRRRRRALRGRGASRQLDASLRARPEGGESGPPGSEAHAAVSPHTHGFARSQALGRGRAAHARRHPKTTPTTRIKIQVDKKKKHPGTLSRHACFTHMSRWDKPSSAREEITKISNSRFKFLIDMKFISKILWVSVSYTHLTLPTKA